MIAMIIGWRTIKALRHPNSQRFTRGILVVVSGLTIRDRFRVLQINDQDSYYASRELVATDMLGDLGAGQDRHYKLSRPAAQRTDADFQQRERPSAGARRAH